LLERRDDRTDVDDRLRSDRVDVLGRHPLADDPLHAVETDAERLLDQLARRPETAVAEVLVLVELAPDRVSRKLSGVGRIVLRVLRNAELRGEVDETLDEGDDVLGRQDPDVVRNADAETLVELVAADPRQVVALRIEEQRPEEVPSVVERRRLARTLFLEHLDQRLLLARRGILLERVLDVDRPVEELEDLLVGRRVELEAGRRVLGGSAPQKRD